MLRFFLTRLSLLIPTFIGVTIVSFLFIRMLPGDPVLLMAGERGITEERYARLLAEFGFDQPLWQQYLVYMKDLLGGNLGNSLITKQPVWDEFFTLFPATVELSICAMIFAICLGIPAGIIAAVRRGSAFDHTVMTTALVGYSMPIFWWGLLLIIFFSGILHWTPVSGRISLIYFFEPVTGFMLIDSLLSGQSGAFRSALSHLILPTVVLGTNPLAVIAATENPLSKQKKLKWGDLVGQKFLVREQGSGTYNAIEQHLKKHHLTIERKMVIESNEAIKYSVKENMGISILSAYVLANAKEDGLTQLNVQTFPISSNWYMVHLKQKKLSLITERFLEFALNRRNVLLPGKAIGK
jgi:ABC-type antimicrobial peptide transport system permease subunit